MVGSYFIIIIDFDRFKNPYATIAPFWTWPYDAAEL